MPAGQFDTALADHRVEPIRQACDDVVKPGTARSLYDIVLSGVKSTIGNILPDCSCEQENILLHDTDIGAKAVQSDIADIGAIDADGAGGSLLEAGKKRTDRRLSGP